MERLTPPFVLTVTSAAVPTVSTSVAAGQGTGVLPYHYADVCMQGLCVHHQQQQ